MQADLQATSSKCSALAQENSLLRERTSPAAVSSPVDDALTEQARSCPSTSFKIWTKALVHNLAQVARVVHITGRQHNACECG